MEQGVVEYEPYVPHGAADELMGAREKEVLIEGPAGTGKTRAVLEKIHVCCLKYPRSRHLLVRSTRESLTESVLVTYEEKVLPPDLRFIADGAKRETRKAYHYPNGSTIVVAGLKAHGQDQRAKVMSTDYDTIGAFEATEISEDDWEKCTTRLRNGTMPYQQAIADCNPGPPTHWLNQRANKGRMKRLLSRHEHNPELYRLGQWTPRGRAYLETLSNLSGARRLRFFSGKWAASEGLVYDNFDSDVHLKDRFVIPADWRRIRSIDFGYTNPFVCQWWAIDGDGRMYLYREIYRSRTIVEDHAKRIMELSDREYIEATISDHDAEDRATAERHGIMSIPAHKSVQAGLQAVEARLRVAGDGKPRLFILRDSLVDGADEHLIMAKHPTCTEHEFDGYVWPKGVDGRPVKEEPVKSGDHGMDAMRYAVAYADGLANFDMDLIGNPSALVS